MIEVLSLFFEKWSWPTCIFATAFIILYFTYKMYELKYRAYNGINPYRCPNCHKNKCKLIKSYRTSDGVAEFWVCTCGTERIFKIH